MIVKKKKILKILCYALIKHIYIDNSNLDMCLKTYTKHI